MEENTQILFWKRLSVIAFLLLLTITITSLFANYIEHNIFYKILTKEQITKTELKSSDLRQQILTILQAAFFTLSLIVLFVFVIKSNSYNRNALPKINILSWKLINVFWWILLLTFIILPAISFLMAQQATRTQKLIMANNLDIISDCFGIIFCLLTLYLLNKSSEGKPTTV